MQLTKNTSDKLRKIASWKLIRNQTKLKFGVGGGECLSLLPSSAAFDKLNNKLNNIGVWALETLPLVSPTILLVTHNLTFHFIVS